MTRKKAVPPTETPEAEMVPPAPEAAPETPSAAQPQTLEVSPVPPASPQAEASVKPEPGPSAPPVIPEEETAVPEDTPETEATSPSGILKASPDFVDPGDGESPAEPEAAPIPEGRPAIVTAAKGLNLREGPGLGFEVLMVLESGTLVLILDLPMGVKVPGWVLACTGEMTGWVSGKHLRALVD